MKCLMLIKMFYPFLIIPSCYGDAGLFTRKICCSLNIRSRDNDVVILTKCSRGRDISRSHELICRDHDKTKWTEHVTS